MSPVVPTAAGIRRCIVGMGQTVAGDDGVGFAVIDELRRRRLPSDVELMCISDAMDLVPLLEGGAHMVLVDAVLARPAGAVWEVALEELSCRAIPGVSSHGIGAAQAIALALVLGPPAAPKQVRIIAVAIERPDHHRVSLSPVAAAAVSVAADRVLALLGS
jgi:hydrogenase maturation protease